MSFALTELARLLTPAAPRVGVVIAIDGPLVRLATQTGALTAHPLGPLVLGDRVQITNGQATRAPVAKQTYPV